MKARIPPEHMLNSTQRKQLNEYYTAVVEQMIEDAKTEFAKQYMMMTVICLNKPEGFGAKRLTRFLDTLNDLTQGEAPQDEEFWAHAEHRCKQLGLSEYFNLEG